jgi:hypothetical protein
MGLFALPAIPPIVEGILLLGAALGIGHQVLPGKQEREQSIRDLGNAMAMSNAQDDAKANADSGTTAATCATGNCGGSDPCAGLRKQLNDHKRKLEDFIKNPYAHDNKGFLGQGRDEVVIAARIRKLQGQISNFEKQLKACEEKNGK